jgi:hypothetical protein
MKKEKYTDEYRMSISLQEGDRFHIVGYYWSSDSSCQETEYEVVARKTERGIKLFDEKTSERFSEGMNSSYKFLDKKLI